MRVASTVLAISDERGSLLAALAMAMKGGSHHDEACRALGGSNECCYLHIVSIITWASIYYNL